MRASSTRLCLTQTLRVAARDADRWRILLKRDWLPTFCNTVFTVGNVALAGLIALSMMPAFGLTFSVVFAAVAVFVNGVCMHAVNFWLLLPLAHPVPGWHKGRIHEIRHDDGVKARQVDAPQAAMSCVVPSNEN